MAGSTLATVVAALAEHGAKVGTVVGYVADAVVVVAGTALVAGIGAMTARALALLVGSFLYVDTFTVAYIRIRLSVD